MAPKILHFQLVFAQGPHLRTTEEQIQKQLPLYLSDPKEGSKGSEEKYEERRVVILPLDIVISLNKRIFSNQSAKLKFKHPNRHWTLGKNKGNMNSDNSVPTNYIRFRKTFSIVLFFCFHWTSLETRQNLFLLWSKVLLHSLKSIILWKGNTQQAIEKQSHSCIGAKARIVLPGREEYQAASHRRHTTDPKPKNFNEATTETRELLQNVAQPLVPHLNRITHLNSLGGVSDPITAYGCYFSMLCPEVFTGNFPWRFYRGWEKGEGKSSCPMILSCLICTYNVEINKHKCSIFSS